MSDLQIDITINQQHYTLEQLDRYEYERTLHVLHEMKRLGAPVRDGDVELSHTDINWLDPQRAQEISLDLRCDLGEEGIVALYREVLADSDARWKKFSQDYTPGEVHTSQTDITMTGVSLPETMRVLSGAVLRNSLAVMPEHFMVVGDISSGQQRIMETFGLFGEPTFVYGTASTEFPDYMPFTADPEYPSRLYGELLLLSDSTEIHVGAAHQFRTQPDGFTIRSIFFCPKGAPRAIADGHTLHFAIELTRGMRIAHQRLTENGSASE